MFLRGLAVIKVELNAETIDQLKEKVAALVLSLGMGGMNDIPSAPPVVEKKEKAPTKKKVEEKAVEMPAYVAPEAPAVSLDAASALLKRVNDSKGLPMARSILTSVGANRMSEVSPEKYAEVISACEKLLA